MVESANKVVIAARLKGAGMHWSRLSVNPQSKHTIELDISKHPLKLKKKSSTQCSPR
jgi:hypothetical protein